MLINLIREVAGQLDDGWFHGLYWRGLRTGLTPVGLNQQSLVYIQVLIPDSSFDLRLRPLGEVGGLPPLYHKDTAGAMSLGRVTTLYGGFPRRCRMQWFETYYGTQYIHTATDRVIECAVPHGWRPWKRGKGDAVYVTPHMFMKHIRPVAQHVCNCIVKARVVPVFADRELELLPNPSVP